MREKSLSYHVSDITVSSLLQVAKPVQVLAVISLDDAYSICERTESLRGHSARTLSFLA